MNEKEIFLKWKMATKTCVMHVYFELTDGTLKSIKCSFLGDYNRDLIIEQMRIVAKKNNFKKWLTPNDLKKINI